ncbi:MAG: AarF/UbiB family protein [Acidobacteriota bacterium]|nr:AarF/UbiB family protein [Acidobacteriota bacterium]
MTSKFGILLKTYASMQRYRQILFVLLKYGFEDLIATLGVDHYLGLKWNPLRKKFAGNFSEMSRAARLRFVLQELGPTFVKMGQALSTRSDMLPEDIMEELTKLQDHVPPFPSDVARRIIEEELGADRDTIYSYFESEPIAAGSIGQVHRARLRENNEDVVVKIQRPGIKRQIHVDLEIMHDLATLMERHMELGQVHKPTRVVEEFARTMEHELDYTSEAANIDRFAELFHGNHTTYIHKVYHAYTTRRVLTLEWIDGYRPNDLDILKQKGLDPALIAKRGAALVMEQVFQHGIFHADPHPGNLLITKGNIICFLDFGMVGRIDRESRELFAETVVRVVGHDEVAAAESLLKLTHAHSLIDRPLLEREISELMDRYLYRPLKDLEVGPMIRSLLDLTVKHELRIPAPFFLLIKSITQIESLGCKLDPDFDLSSQLEPFLKRIIMARYHPRRVVRQVYETGSDLLYLMREVPGEMRELIKQARTGRFKVELEHLGLGPLRSTIEKTSARISSAIVLASLIVGSSLIVHSGVPPKWHDIPIIGLGGYLVSGIMGFSLLRAIVKDRRG